MTPADQADHLLGHLRRLRVCHGRAVGLSSRQAAGVIGASRPTAARRLAALVREGRLLLVTPGYWDRRTGTPGPASEYDLPEFVSAATVAGVAAVRPADTPAVIPAGRYVDPTSPPYTRTPLGLVAVWQWSPRQQRWLHYGDFADQAAAEAVAGRHMTGRSGRWAVGDQVLRYARGRCLKVVPGAQAPPCTTDEPTRRGRARPGGAARRG